MLRYQEIGEILSLIDSSSCDELVLETEGVKLVVRRQAGGGFAPAITSPGAAPDKAAAPAVKAPGAPSAARVAPAGTASGSAGFVGAPMVGTLYRSPSPEAPPFVEVGTRVKVGDPLCVIEVMKLFSTIHAEVAGTIREIGAENAQFVEFGQMIFIIDPD